jgi:hypothetical protein
MALYYLDGSTLSDSTAVYTDVGLTICAADGFYSDNTIVRELANCVLLPAQACPSCNVPCSSSSTISLSSGGQGMYRTSINVGNTGTSVGAIIVEFNPRATPKGIQSLYNGVAYNKISSPVDGYHASTTPANFTFIGDIADDCGISGSTYLIPEYNYSYINTQFEATGNTQSLTVAAGDVSLSSAQPGECVMVIPKLSANPDTLNINVPSPCAPNTFTLKVYCPRLLTGISSTFDYSSKIQACETDPSTTIYNVPVNGTFGLPGIYDWIFYDEYGQGLAVDGWYKLASGDVIHVVDGVVVAIEQC